MTIAGFLTETKRKWKSTFRKLRKSKPKTNSVSPSKAAAAAKPSGVALAASYSGTVDASDDISVETYGRFAPFPALRGSDPDARPISTYENVQCNYDSAYETDQSSPTGTARSRSDSTKCPPAPRAVAYSYCNLRDKEDANSIATDVTWLDYDAADDGCEHAQNYINERIELVTSL